MFKLFLILISLFLYSSANSIVLQCEKENLNKLCINNEEIQSKNELTNISYLNSEITFVYNIDGENKPFLSKVSIKNLDDSSIIEQIIDATASDKFFTKKFKFNADSFLINETLSGSDIQTRVTKYEHGTINGNYGVKTINPLNQIATNIYDSNKNIIKHIDINGLETSFEYDVDENLVKKTDPNNIITTYVYSTEDLVPTATKKVIQTTPNKPTIIHFYDENNKLLVTHKEGYDGRYIVTDLTDNYLPYFKGEDKYLKPQYDSEELIENNLEIEYNALGYKIKATDPSSLKVTTYTYDLLDRVVKEETIKNGNEDNKEIIYYVYDRANYGQGKISYIKSDAYKKEFFYNELSQLKSTKEYIGNKIFANQFSYTPNGQLEKTITPNGLEIINEYNQYGYLSGVKTPRTIMSDFNIKNSKELLVNNLNDRFTLYKEYLDLKAKLKIYSLKREIYNQLSSSYTDADIKQKLIDVVALLDDTILLLTTTTTEYEKALVSYDTIINNTILPLLTQKNDGETFKDLYSIFENKRQEYIALGTKYLDMANTLLEEAITQPGILTQQFNHHKEMITHYKQTATDTIALGSIYSNLSNTYQVKYYDIKHGKEESTGGIYTGMFDDPDYKYFYKVLEQNAFNKTIKAIHGNGVVTSTKYDLSSGNITRVTIGYYGQDDIKDLRYNYNSDGNLDASYDVKKSFTKRYSYDSENRLIRATNVGKSYYTNISYDFDQPSVYQHNDSENRFENTQNNLKVRTDKTYDIADNNVTISSNYSPAKNSYEKTISSLNSDSSRYYKADKTFKYSVKPNEIIYKNFIYADNILVAINIQNEVNNVVTPLNYYIHNDLDGSLDIITNELALVEEKIYYRPYGQLSDKSWINVVNVNEITNIGYKGFEHDIQFDLIDLGSYVYDPKYAKALTKDTIQNPLKTVQMSQNIQSLTTFTNTVISEEIPNDITKVWYKPNSIDGGMDIYTYKNGDWQLIGSIGKLNQVGEVTTQTIDELTSLSCFEGDKGFVTSSTNKVAYKCSDANSWDMGGEFVGTYNIIDLATTYFSALDGTTITAVASNNEFSGSKTFTKNGNYWVDSTSNFYIFDSLNNVLAQSIFTVGDVVFFPKDSVSYDSLKRYSIVNIGEKWVSDSIIGTGTSTSYPADISWKYLVNERETFTAPVTGEYRYGADTRWAYKNLTKNNNFSCTNNTWGEDPASGTSKACYYKSYECLNGGTLSGTNCVKENLGTSPEIINAVPITDIVTMYNELPTVALVENEIFIKELDTLNRNIYKRVDGVYIAKNGAVISSSYLDSSSVISLPPSFDATTVTFDSEQRVILDNRTQATDWNDAPNGVGISIPSINKIYTHIVNGTLDFWTDNTANDGQENATEIFTKGSRSNLPIVTHEITALTKEVGSEPNYTTTGVVSSIDNSFKQWYYSLTGTIVNNLLDSPPCNSSTSCYALTTPVALHATGGLLTKVSGAWKQSNGNYLARHNSLNNKFVSSINIALNATGYISNCGGVYYDIATSVRKHPVFNLTTNIVYYTQIYHRTWGTSTPYNGSDYGDTRQYIGVLGNSQPSTATQFINDNMILNGYCYKQTSFIDNINLEKSPRYIYRNYYYATKYRILN